MKLKLKKLLFKFQKFILNKRYPLKARIQKDLNRFDLGLFYCAFFNKSK